MSHPDLKAWTDGRVLCQAFERLAFGVLPFEQWMPVFANTAFKEWPGLRCKAFTVWFPTMLDYIRGAAERSQLQRELSDRNVNFYDLFSRCDKLERTYRAALGLFSRDDQLFLRDRRLQNVHGKLHIYTHEEHKVRWYDAAAGAVTKSTLSAQEYRAVVGSYYSDMQANTLRLLDSFLGSAEFSYLLDLYNSELQVDNHLLPLARRIGITSS